jgi:16S rRNA (adenine1518-N6/adenine1519-N6)-dimethyltransferase
MVFGMRDQHFMTDAKILERIVSAAGISGRTVLEIGAGRGSLTRELAKKAGKVIAIEIDRKFERDLEENLRGFENVELIFGNALEIIKKRKFDKMVSNIPYAICESLLQELVFLEFESAVLTLPGPFVQRIKAKPGDKNFSRLSILAGEFFGIKTLFEIPKEAFHPQPRTKSLAVLLKPGPRDSLFCRVFLRRKMKLKNAIMRALLDSKEMTKNQARKTIKSLKFNNLLDKKTSEMDTGELRTVWRKLQEI